MVEETTVKNGELRIKDEKGRFTKNNPGRRKGSKDKYTGIKNAFLGVFTELGIDNLKQFALDHPKEFYSICGRMLPTNGKLEMTGDVPKNFNIMISGENGKSVKLDPFKIFREIGKGQIGADVTEPLDIKR